MRTRKTKTIQKVLSKTSNDINTKSAIKDHLYDCDKCSSMKHSVESFKILKKCVTEYDTKIQEALFIKKLNPKLNKQLYAKGASFLLSIF